MPRASYDTHNSDVSTIEEWRVVAKDIVPRNGGVNWRAAIVEAWFGLLRQTNT